MTEWNIAMENILEKRRIKVEKAANENFQLFMLNICKLQTLISKA